MPSAVRKIVAAVAEAWRTRALLAGGLLALACCGLGALPAGAQLLAPEGSNRIADIRIEGVRRVEPGQVLSVIVSRVNSVLNADLVSKDLRSIFALGYFSDVRAEVEPVPGQGVRLVFAVSERPRIVSLKFAGNKLIETKALQDAIAVKPGSFYSQAAMEKALEKIRGMYREKGQFKVRLSSELERAGEQEYAVTIRFEEAARIFVTDVKINGAKAINEMTLKRLMVTVEVDCFEWMNSYGQFDEDRINYDMQAISAEFSNQGYIRVSIAKPKITLVHGPDFSRISVELTITEGERYFTGAVDIAGDLLNDRSDILREVRLTTGSPFSPAVMNRDMAVLTELYQEQGYAFAQVIPDRRINEKTRIVDVTYNLRAGEKATIRRIEFQGNRETRDFVMRREFLVGENELYNGRKLRESNANLRALGYFKPSTALEPRPTDVNNVLDVVTKIEESQTGTLQGQIGYSELSGITGSVSLSKANLGGRGQSIRLGAEFAERNVRNNFFVEFSEPRLFGTDFASSSSLGYANREDQTELARGLLTEMSLSQGVGYRLLPRLQVNFSVEATNREFRNTDIRPIQLRSFSTSLTYRSVNNPTFPSDGSILSGTVTQVGGEILGGTTQYRRYNFNVQRFLSLNPQSTLILMGRMRLGWLEQVPNNEIPIEDRYRIGGYSTVHGYQFGEIGGPMGYREHVVINGFPVPRVDAAGNPVVDINGLPLFSSQDRRTIGFSEEQLSHLVGGGIQQRIFNLELLFPLASDNVRGVIFYDAGNVNAERLQYELLREKEPEFLDLLVGYGLGVRLISPVGVLRFEYGVKAAPARGESPDKFEFTISTLF